ncbi:disease resistance protein RUN1-like [Daucus carota subsp. sativus]|uniref:disease resistance protein RUN1-like n=1 Tax=Daucus carota subsp. sativus TaxID=79200 RepID=UPI0007F0257F|nr:PREDICTED: TMV resistance protein N-like [Daucus carota subsp. sativus]
MASTSNPEITAASPSSPSSSSSSSPSPPIAWDVFLSFYGDDTRKTFTSHLYSALDQAGILTFRDDPALEKGQEISPGLCNAITDSKMFVVVISENYARSPWCLNELVEILSCKKTENQVVPVFYYVDPSDVRHQKGSFGDALDYHKKRYSPDIIDKWKSALYQTAELSGYHLKKHANENESETIKSIVENVARQVSTKVLRLGGDLYGIDSAVEEIYQKLRTESKDVRAIGICGMGGIGKTTIAKAFYNKYHSIFDCCCFVENVKQYSQGGDFLIPLLEQLLIVLLGRKNYKVLDADSGIRQLKQILHFKKALIILDDLNQSICSEFLGRHCNLFSAGSRIIVTTRDVSILDQLKIYISDVDIYMVNKLGQTHSLELFSYHAFGKPQPPASLREHSISFVAYAGGLPLALKVLGSSLCGRTQDELFWKAKLEKVRKIPENGILEILQLSYNELNDESVKSIFLDIAFFFVGKYKYEAVDIFESCEYYPEVGIRILLERCLLTIDNQRLRMHDLIQEMGRDIAKKTRLFLRANAWEDLQNHEGLDNIEGLVLDLSQSTKKQINSQIFERLPRLRLLEIINAHDIKGHFKNSFHELRCFYWNCCTWTKLPSSFRPQKLISLVLPYSNLKMLWDDAQPFMSLKIIVLSYSVNLKTTPNFKNSKVVERLYFAGCESLQKVHPSIRELANLYVLDLRECIHLKDEMSIYSVKRLSEPVKQWPNMGYLRLGHYHNLRRLPEQLGDMKWLKELDASYTAIEELPDSITQLKELAWMKLDGCKKLRKLPEQIGNMEGLRTFLANSSAIEQLPDSFVGLVNLEILIMSSCKNLRNLPNSIWKLQLLQVLNLGWCKKLERLPEELGMMQCLEILNVFGTAIQEVPDSIGLLSRLRLLDLSYCHKLKYLPSNIWNLASLETLHLSQEDIKAINLPDAVKDTKLVCLTLKCNIRLWLPTILSFPSLEHLILCDESENLSSTNPFSFSGLYNLQVLEFYGSAFFGSSFLELPFNITHLCLGDHATLVHLPDLSSLKQLKKFYIIRCISLESLPPLPHHLQTLTVYYCPSLQEVSNISLLKELSHLNFGRCSYQKSFSSRKSPLQVINQYLRLYESKVPKMADWLSYKSSGHTISFDIPPQLGDNLLGLALSVDLSCKGRGSNLSIRAAVTNKTNGTTKYCVIPLYINCRQVYSLVQCISADKISIRSGDEIRISFQRDVYIFNAPEVVLSVPMKVKMCAVHVIPKTLSPDFCSVLSNLIK